MEPQEAGRNARLSCEIAYAMLLGLRPRRAHCRALARIEHAELNAGAVRGLRHQTAERIDLFDEMPLADAADRRVATHLPERLDIVREQQRATAAPRGRKRRFGAGMPAADHDDVVLFLIKHRRLLRLEQASILPVIASQDHDRTPLVIGLVSDPQVKAAFVDNSFLPLG